MNEMLKLFNPSTKKKRITLIFLCLLSVFTVFLYFLTYHHFSNKTQHETNKQQIFSTTSRPGFPLKSKNDNHDANDNTINGNDNVSGSHTLNIDKHNDDDDVNDDDNNNDKDDNDNDDYGENKSLSLTSKEQGDKNAKCGANGMTRERVGYSTWTLLHSLVSNLENKKHIYGIQESYEYVKQHIHLTAKLFPCQSCSNDFQQLLQKFPFPPLSNYQSNVNVLNEKKAKKFDKRKKRRNQNNINNDMTHSNHQNNESNDENNSKIDNVRKFTNNNVNNENDNEQRFEKMRMELSIWLCEQHNRVNQKLGKDMFDCSLQSLDAHYKMKKS